MFVPRKYPIPRRVIKSFKGRWSSKSQNVLMKAWAKPKINRGSRVFAGGEEWNQQILHGRVGIFLWNNNAKRKCVCSICCSCGSDQWNIIAKNKKNVLNGNFSCNQLHMTLCWTHNYISLKSAHKNDLSFSSNFFCHMAMPLISATSVN